ncbi:MAG: VWA domain-containing protein [Candidatus Obscuribacterales bacterium]|nr:VWA domain-containing protein [Candidatus Obscuribacterales bacterium]
MIIAKICPSTPTPASRFDTHSICIVLVCCFLISSICPVFASESPLSAGTASTRLESGTSSTTLEGGTGSTTLQGGAGSTTLSTGTSGALLQGRTEHKGGPVTILFLVDASLSMRDNLERKVQKIDAAKKVLEKSMLGIPPDVKVGLRVFGHFAQSDFDPCRASILLVKPGLGNRGTIINKMRRIRPTGMTPLTFAIAQAAENDLRAVRGRKTIILITDGAETCGHDPCAYIQTLAARGIDLKVDVVGLDLRRDVSARNQLNCIASKSGGKYYDAKTASELIESVSNSVSKAISGKVVIGSDKDNIANPDTPPELIPIVPMGRLEDTRSESQKYDPDNILELKPEPSESTKESKSKTKQIPGKQ